MNEEKRKNTAEHIKLIVDTNEIIMRHTFTIDETERLKNFYSKMNDLNDLICKVMGWN